MLDANEDIRGLNQRDYAKAALLVEGFAKTLDRDMSYQTQVNTNPAGKIRSVVSNAPKIYTFATAQSGFRT